MKEVLYGVYSSVAQGLVPEIRFILEISITDQRSSLKMCLVTDRVRRERGGLAEENTVDFPH